MSKEAIKPGDVVRSKYAGAYYVVEEVLDGGCLVFAPSGPWSFDLSNVELYKSGVVDLTPKVGFDKVVQHLKAGGRARRASWDLESAPISSEDGSGFVSSVLAEDWVLLPPEDKP